MASHDARVPSAPRRLRVPTALAVALVGSSASLTISFAGCDVPDKARLEAPPPVVDARDVDAPDGVDAAPLADAGIDSLTADAAVDARPDARPDAVDARPDAPVV